MLLDTIQLSKRALQFYYDAFAPQYEAFKRAASHTPLVLLMWGPSGDWYRQRLAIRDALVEHGHQVVFREDLGIPSGLVPQRAIDLIPGYSADLAVIIQSAYASIGEVQHFAEFRVVESRMLVFMDEAAKDRRSYLPSVAQLQLLYNNAETFKSPEDIVKGRVLQMVLNKVAIFQMVKCVAMRSSRRWGLNLLSYPSAARGEDLRVFPLNLLELYRVHRGEINLLNDSSELFLLALINQMQGYSHKTLAHDAGLVGPGLQRKLTPLLTGRLLDDANGTLQPTELGKQILSAIGLPEPKRPAPRHVPTVAARSQPVPTRYLAAGAGFSFLALFIAALFLWFGAVQQQLPLVLTPARNTPAVTATSIPTVTPTVQR